MCIRDRSRAGDRDRAVFLFPDGGGLFEKVQPCDSQTGVFRAGAGRVAGDRHSGHEQFLKPGGADAGADRDQQFPDLLRGQVLSLIHISIFAVSSVPMAKLYYQEFKKQMAADPTRNLRVATIFSYGANEEESDGILDEENSEDTSALDQPSRDFLEEAIRDYNEMFHTNYDTSGDKSVSYTHLKLLEGKGSISHKQAIEKAEREFEIYRAREMRQLESDFDRAVKMLQQKGAGKNE